MWARRQDRQGAERSAWPELPFAAGLARIAASYADGVPQTFEGPLQVIAVRSAMDLIASLASELPFGVYSGEGGSRTKWQTPGNLLDPAGDGHGAEDWAYQVICSYLLRGNLYGNVLANGPQGRLDQVAIYNPDAVGGWVDPATGKVQWVVDGVPLDEKQESAFLHRRVNPVPGMVLGLSPIEKAMGELGIAVSAARFGRQWFTDGAHPSGILSNSERDIGKENADTAKKRFLAALRGTREPLVLGRGWKFDRIQVSPEESQFLQTRGYSAAESCRIFGPAVADILGYETHQSMTYSNRVDRAQDFLTFTLDKWVKRLERLRNQFLPGSRYVVIDRDNLLIMNMLERYSAYEKAAKIKLRVINEMRDKENLPAVPWGDTPQDFASTGGSKGSDRQPGAPNTGSNDDDDE